MFTKILSEILKSCFEDSHQDKDLGVWVNERLNESCQCALLAQKANCTLRCIQSSMASMAKQGFFPLCSALVRPHLECCIQLWAPVTRKMWTYWNKSNGGSPRWPEGWTHLSYKERLREEKALERPFSTFQDLKGTYKRAGERLLTVACIDRIRANGLIAEGG